MTTLLPLANLPEASRRELDRIGKSWASNVPANVEATIAIYTPLAAAAPPTTASIFKDVPYGSHERQVMDIFQPAASQDGKAADVLLFLHGGAFVRGAKCVNDEIYANLCRWFADRGVLAVNVEYRLAGDAPFPGGALDLAAAVDYMTQHAAEYGGDPTRIFVMGHSAGGSHVGTYCYDHHVGNNGRALLSDAVRGAIIVSARLRADVRSTNPNAHAVRAYFGDDESLYDLRTSTTHAPGSLLPTLIAVAQYENPHLDLYGAELFHRLMAGVEQPDGTVIASKPRFVQMMKHNHMSITAHFNTGEEYLGLQILDFMRAA